MFNFSTFNLGTKLSKIWLWKIIQIYGIYINIFCLYMIRDIHTSYYVNSICLSKTFTTYMKLLSYSWWQLFGFEIVICASYLWYKDIFFSVRRTIKRFSCLLKKIHLIFFSCHRSFINAKFYSYYPLFSSIYWRVLWVYRYTYSGRVRLTLSLFA